MVNESVLKNDERIMFELRELYQRYGYGRFKMSRFEEYDLYAKNKDFLVSDGAITFTDASGRLMALKPDVTLSIVKNAKLIRGTTQKYYYSENVFRMSAGTRMFEEIMQTGLECIGDLDRYQQAEVVLLAVQSLKAISSQYVLDISHMGIVTEMIAGTNLSGDKQTALLDCLKRKDAGGIKTLCDNCGVPGKTAERLLRLSRINGTLINMLPELSTLCREANVDNALEDLRAVAGVLAANELSDRVRLDFSVVNSMNYYSGLVFHGFVDGIPQGILSGGRYDRLMQKMGKSGGAAGFAVYLNLLERLNRGNDEYDVDTLLLYNENTPPQDLSRAVRELESAGLSVTAQRVIPETLRFRRCVRLENGRIENDGN